MRSMVSAGEPISSPRDEPRLRFAAERYRSAQAGPGLPRGKSPVDLDRHDCGNVRYVERLQILRIDENDLRLGSAGNQRQGMGDGAAGRRRTIHRDNDSQRFSQWRHILQAAHGSGPRLVSRYASGKRRRS
jgi:hypothetical protein